VNLHDFEEKVRRLPGVEAARVVGEGGVVTEVHVLTGLNKAAKQVVRDVQSLAQAVFGLSIDRRVVSVVQLPDPDLAQGDRPVIIDVSEQTDGNRTRVAVTLGWQGETLIGEVAGAAAHTTRNRLVAEATIEALRQALQETTAIGVAAVDLPLLGSRAVAIAQVVMVNEGAERLMVGSALVDGESGRAVVRAVLDALNRHIPELRR
jgi:DNA-binding protein Fis